jgi:hypothetical protein
MNPKLRLQNGVGTEFSCLKSRKDPSQKPYIKKKYILFIWDFGWDHKNEAKIWENLKSRH